MKLRHFVSGSSALLAGWLTVTFFNHVPAQRYPRLDRDSTAAISPVKPTVETDATGRKSAVFTVSVSR
jgi:hypothetical protein